jgi:hypothetical protein
VLLEVSFPGLPDSDQQSSGVRTVLHRALTRLTRSLAAGGLAFYNALRFNRKKAVLLAYPGEGHHLGGVANQKDLTVRIMEFFDYYLKGAPAPTWLSEGMPYLKKDEKKNPPKEPANN